MALEPSALATDILPLIKVHIPKNEILMLNGS
jgi:hypothetical protein